jgi:hypothetical protein
MNIHEVITTAKLGRARRDAQVDTCSVFAAALYDVLQALHVDCKMVSVENKGVWAHSLVEVDGRYYDSMGEFTTAICRQRAKIHSSVSFELLYTPDCRVDCYEPEFEEMYAFYVKMLNKSISLQAVVA